MAQFSEGWVVRLAAMRLGCGGCLSVLGLLCVVGLLAAGTVWLIGGVFESPGLAPPSGTAEDGVSAQQKIYDLSRGGAGQAARRRPATVALSENELNAFLSRHLAQAAELPLKDLSVRLPARDRLELSGRLPLRALLSELPGGSVFDAVPAPWRDRPVWVRLRGTVRLDPGGGGRRYFRFDADGFWLGRRRLPTVLIRLLFSPLTLRLFRWPAPDSIEDLAVEPGRVVIRVGA
jgi:hypothetical protein